MFDALITAKVAVHSKMKIQSLPARPHANGKSGEVL